MRVETIIAVASWLVLLFVCSYAIGRGGRPERVGAAINLLACFATVALRLTFTSAWFPAALSILIVDIAVTGCFYWLAVTTDRFWPIWAFGFASSALLASVAGALLPKVELLAYHTGLGIYANLALVALALGTFRLPREASPLLRHGSRRA